MPTAGYYSNRHADLLFELVSRRYEHNSTIVTTNRPFAEWREVFPNAACVVSLVDRLVHNAESSPSRANPIARPGVVPGLQARRRAQGNMPGALFWRLCQLVNAKAIAIAKLAVRATTAAGSGHPTSALSLAHLIATLMYHAMRWRPEQQPRSAS